VLLALVLSGLVAAPAHATFPGANGKIAYFKEGSSCLQMVNPDGTGNTEPGRCDIDPATAYQVPISSDGKRVLAASWNPTRRVYDRKISNLDGTNAVILPGLSREQPLLSWSNDGQLIATVFYRYTCDSCPYGVLYAAPADGSAADTFVSQSTPSDPADWAPNDERLVLSSRTLIPERTYIITVAPDGSDSQTLVSSEFFMEKPDWSPDGTRIVFHRSNDVAVVNADGTELRFLTGPNDASTDSSPTWSPDGTKILFHSNRPEGGGRGPFFLYTMNPDGTEQTAIGLGTEIGSIWSPDGTKIAFYSDRDGDYDIYTMNRDGSGVVQVTNNPGSDRLLDWQALPAGYPRPKGASTEWVSLVPAYKPCTASNSTHGSPLASPSCNPPVQSSDYLTVGSADSNGKPTKATSQLLLLAQPGDPTTAADEADMKITD
jgi:WD40 repeat protein